MRLLPWMDGVKADGSTHPLQPLRHALAAGRTVPVACGSAGSSPWSQAPGRASFPLQALRGWLPSLVRTLHFIGTTPESDSWPACLWVVRLSPSPTGLPPNCAADADQASRFSCMMFPAVRGVFDCAGVARGLRVSAPVRMVFAVCYRIDTLNFFTFSPLHTRPVHAPVYASPPALSRRTAKPNGGRRSSCWE